MGVDSLTSSVLETHTWRTDENIRQLNAAAAANGGGDNGGAAAAAAAAGAASSSSGSSGANGADKQQQSLSSHWYKQIPLTPDDQFDIASCQFAMHYMFQVSE